MYPGGKEDRSIDRDIGTYDPQRDDAISRRLFRGGHRVCTGNVPVLSCNPAKDAYYPENRSVSFCFSSITILPD